MRIKDRRPGFPLSGHCSVLLPTVAIIVASVVGFAQQSQPTQSKNDDMAQQGEKLFAARCSLCHGIDGRGGEGAPNIANASRAERLQDSELLRIVRNGIPSAGMPSFGSLGDDSTLALVTYLRVLQGKTDSESRLPGNSQDGKLLFYGKAECSKCHMINGAGGFIASDLTTFGQGQDPAAIEAIIADPNKHLDQRARSVTVETNSGKSLTGIIRNEDNFSVVLQALDGSFELLSRNEIKHIDLNSHLLMPDNYRSTLSKMELNDIVSFLMSVHVNPPWGPSGVN